MERNTLVDRILILDDDADMLEIYKRHLSQIARRIDACMTIGGLITCMSTNKYDFVILDYMVENRVISDYMKDIVPLKRNDAKLLISTGYEPSEVRKKINGDVMAVFSKDNIKEMLNVIEVLGTSKNLRSRV